MSDSSVFAMPPKQLLRFGLVGVANTVVSVVIILTLHKGLGIGLVLSNAIGYTVGLVQSFLLNRRWTFEHKGAARRAMVLFGLVVAVAFAVSMGVIKGLMALGTGYFIAQCAGVVTYSVLGFWGSRNVAFKDGD